MLKFIICEDNKETLDRTSLIISKVMMPYDFDYKIYKFEKYDSQLKKIIETKDNDKVYILDVELPKISGLEIASEIRENDWNSIIVFLTAHRECQDDIFYSRLLALDYISKNRISFERLEETIKMIISKMNQNKILTFKYNGITSRIPYDDIIYVEKVPENKKCLIITENNNIHEIQESISHLLEKLGPDFYQTHKSCIVNVTKIKKVDYSNNIITFKNNDKIDLLSNRNRKGLREYVKNY